MDIGLLWAAFAIWLSWLGVALWQWILTRTSIEVLWRSPKLASSLRIFTILWIALVESAVIYWFIVAFQIIWAESLESGKAIWAWLSIWIAALGVWYWEGKLVSWAMHALELSPDSKASILQFMILFIALVESAAIYALVISQKILVN